MGARHTPLRHPKAFVWRRGKRCCGKGHRRLVMPAPGGCGLYQSLPGFPRRSPAARRRRSPEALAQPSNRRRAYAAGGGPVARGAEGTPWRCAPQEGEGGTG